MPFKTLAPALLVLALSAPALPAAAAQPDMRGFFVEVDRDKDGCATYAEWKRAGLPDSAYGMLKDDKGCVTLSRLHEVPAPEGIDRNGDGRVTLAEFLAFDKKMSAQFAAQKKAQDKEDRAMAARLDLGRETQALQNLMARRMYFHSVGQNENELALWSQKQPVRWAQNQGCWVGMASLKVYYDDVNRQMQAASLKRLSQLNPAIRNVPENRYIGNTVLHLLTTPIIEVALDGQSAKGMWYTPGAILTSEDGKTPQGIWMWERYGVDFVKEDGQWRFLNIQVMTDFGNPMGRPLQPQGAAMGSEGGAPAPAPGADGVKVPGPDIARPLYSEFSPTRVPTITPRLPEPYRRLGETFQYADCSGEHDKSPRR